MFIEEREFLKGYTIGGRRPFFLIAGPCVIESRSLLEKVCESMLEVTSRLGILFIFKSSFDKANRSSGESRRGPGIDEGLKELDHIRSTYNVPVLTDVHETDQVATCASVVDILQIPAFLSRQTDLVTACADSGKWVNVKKGQFMAPADTGKIAMKVESRNSKRYMVTERGYTFGYNNLVFDPRSVEVMHRLGIPVVFDGTHSTQLPGGGAESGGERSMTPVLMRTAVAAVVEGLFMEVHPNPAQAWSDASNQFPLDLAAPMILSLFQLDRLVKEELALHPEIT